jgi:hypothetical protein
MPEPRIIRDYPPGQFYTLGYIASKCGISYVTALIYVLYRGIIPDADFRGIRHDKERLYTLPQVEAIVFAFRKCRGENGKVKSAAELKATILEAWTHG